MNTSFSITEYQPDVETWRKDFHQNPELGFDTFETSRKVAAFLTEFGCDEVVTGIGQTGVVGVIHGAKSDSGKVVGLRADMDALPIQEASDFEHASKKSGAMHACGHDGHMAVLLSAARFLCQSRAFNGTVVVIFQPAEETGGGANAMLEDGLVTRFGVQEVYGLHNFPGMPVGQFAICEGPMLAAVEEFKITVRGHGGHAGQPNTIVDTILIASQIVVTLQTVVSRNMDPTDAAVLSVTSIDTGKQCYNVVPEKVELSGAIRSLTKESSALMKRAAKRLVKGTASAMGAQAEIEFFPGFPATVNRKAQTEFAAGVAADVVGDTNVIRNINPVMASEDFGCMLEKIPGAFIFLGNGFSAPLHHPNYDFNDFSIVFGTSYWTRLAEKAMPLR